MSSYVVATVKSWNIDAFEKNHSDLGGRWHLITSPDKLQLKRLNDISPDFIFFPHWSWIVPEQILSSFDCVCFHMTDVPYGRGGSPLQNLIVRGHTKTKLTALKMTEELDAGPVYSKRDLDLSGAAHQIYSRASKLAWEMIAEIIRERPEPIPQAGEVTEFERRKPEESEVDWSKNPAELYDHIRMLDADSYPRAFSRVEDKTLEFKNACVNESGELVATVTIIKNGECRR